jgi:hypothetical protein
MDADWLKAFQVNLKPYLHNKGITAWDDTKMWAGDEWQEEIKNALALSKVAVLLLSPDFLASDFISQEELPYLLDVSRTEQVRVLPVAVRPCAWSQTPLREKQFVNNPSRPLSGLPLPDREQELVRICEKVTSYFVERPPIISRTVIESQSRSAGEGLNALVELMDNPEVMARVEAANRLIKTVKKQVELLGYYKDLHDFLHTLQLKYSTSLTQLLRDVRRDENDMEVCSDTVNYENVLQCAIVDAWDCCRRMSPQRSKLTWIEKLPAQLEELFEAIHRRDAQRIEVTIKPVKNLLATEPANINARLVGAAEALHLEELNEALNNVSRSLNRAGLRRATREKFERGVGALEGLRTGLDVLINSHNEWQQIDSVMRRIDGNLNTDPADLQDSWDDLREQIVAQYLVYETESWARLLKEAVDKLDIALEQGELEEVKKCFKNLKTRGSHRFYPVDVELKNLCKQLREGMDEPLRNVLGKLNRDEEETDE